jgi:DMSO/TMAO reductase YedYZ heme-binding membrane subunit
MLLGIRSTKVILLRHLGVAVFSALLVHFFYLSYSAWGVEPALWPDWDQDHPFWRAWAHAAFVLLFLALILGPVARLWHPLVRFITWRRELGIWFAVLAIGHGYAIWDRWARWDIGTLFGFEYMEDLDSYILFRPEVGIMNMMGLMALPLIILLAVTSFDRAVSFLGISSWKHLHSSLINAIFYILVLRGVLYLFFFFQVSPPNWTVYPSIWFLYVFLGMGVFAVLLQAAAFAKTVLQQRSYGQPNSVFQISAVMGVAALLVLPMVLTAGTVAYFDSRVAKEPPMFAGQTQPENEYAQSFHMVIHDAGQDIHLWARDLDGAPYFRQTVEIEGSPVVHQIYRYGEQALFIAERNEAGELVWSKIENVSPGSIGISEVAAGPGAWAAQYGTGEHQIQAQEGMLQVTIHSAGEEITDEVFEIPEEANLVPETQ